MPSLGADMEAGTLVEWLKQPGDVVQRGDVVAVVDTQKGGDSSSSRRACSTGFWCSPGTRCR